MTIESLRTFKDREVVQVSGFTEVRETVYGAVRGYAGDKYIIELHPLNVKEPGLESSHIAVTPHNIYKIEPISFMYTSSDGHWEIKNEKGEFHCEFGPALTGAYTGAKYFCIDGKILGEEEFLEHTKKLITCSIYPNGMAEYRNAKKQLHREDGPAVTRPDGAQTWLLNDELHRKDGPAVITSTGGKEWWFRGVQFSEKVFNRRTPKPTSSRIKVASSTAKQETLNFTIGKTSLELTEDQLKRLAGLVADRKPFTVRLRRFFKKLIQPISRFF